jgi:hypothetical protein
MAGKVECRLSRRYPLKLQLTYMAVCNQVLRLGYGVSIDISRGGVLFWPDAELALGTRVELSLNWPATPDGDQLRLLMYGSVVRCGRLGAAAVVERQRLVREGAAEVNGATPEWEQILARFRCKLLKLGHPVEPRHRTSPRTDA